MPAIGTPTAEDALCPALDAAIEREPAGRRRRLIEVLERLGRSDLEGSGRLLDAFLDEHPRLPVALGLKGLLLTARGEADEARRWFERAAEGGEAWPHALRAAIALRTGSLEDARRHLDAAIEISPDADALELRASILSDLGYVPEAIEDIGRVIAFRGPEARLYFKRAGYHLQRRKYPPAAEDLARAIEKDPEEPLYLAKRSDMRLMLGRLDEAQEDVDAAVRLAPGDEELLFAQVRLLLMRGKTGPAAARLRRMKGSADGARLSFYEGYAKLKRGRFAAASAHFRRLCEGLPEADPMSMKARFFWLLARAVEPRFMKRHGMRLPKAVRPQLFLYGLGIFPPYDMPINELFAMLRSDVLFNNLPHTELREVLHAFRDDVRVTYYDAIEDEFYWADRMFETTAKKKAVSFVTRGHPLMFGRLACECVRRAKESGLRHETLVSPTSVEVLTARTALLNGEPHHGYQVYNIPAIEKAEALNTSVPSIVNFYYGVERGAVAGVRKTLERLYPADRTVLMYGPKYDTDPVPLRLRELEQAYPAIHPSLILYLPPLGAEEPTPELPAPKTAEGSLHLLGLGLFPPWTAPADTLHALSRSDVAFSLVPGTKRFVSEFCPEVVETAAASPQDELAAAGRVLEELGRGKVVSVVLRGHPTVFGPLPRALLRACRKAGVEVETRWSPSPHGFLLAKLGVGIGEHIQGIQTYDPAALRTSPFVDRSHPTLACFFYGAEGAEARALLERHAPEDPAVTVFGPAYDSPWTELRLSELGRLPANTILYLPPKGGIRVPKGWIPGFAPRGERRKRKDA